MCYVGLSSLSIHSANGYFQVCLIIKSFYFFILLLLQRDALEKQVEDLKQEFYQTNSKSDDIVRSMMCYLLVNSYFISVINWVMYI